MSNQHTGTVKWFNTQKGYGFIEREDDQDIFVHYSAIDDPYVSSLQEGEKVTFEIGEGRKGPAAQNVRRISQ